MISNKLLERLNSIFKEDEDFARPYEELAEMYERAYDLAYDIALEAINRLQEFEA